MLLHIWRLSLCKGCMQGSSCGYTPVYGNTHEGVCARMGPDTFQPAAPFPFAPQQPTPSLIHQRHALFNSSFVLSWCRGSQHAAAKASSVRQHCTQVNTADVLHVTCRHEVYPTFMQLPALLITMRHCLCKSLALTHGSVKAVHLFLLCYCR